MVVPPPVVLAPLDVDATSEVADSIDMVVLPLVVVPVAPPNPPAEELLFAVDATPLIVALVVTPLVTAALVAALVVDELAADELPVVAVPVAVMSVVGIVLWELLRCPSSLHARLRAAAKEKAVRCLNMLVLRLT